MIQAIETSYAGCKFRSRLEARWAVLLDRLNIKWEYETQGYLVGDDGSKRPYLPDFWLPNERLWVEVKGGTDQLDHDLIRDALVPRWGLPADSGAYTMLILGPIPRPGGNTAHSILTFHEGDIYRSWAQFAPIGGLSITEPYHEFGGPHWLGNDCGLTGRPDPGLADAIPLPGTSGSWITDAYTAARSARFEHGQRGA